MIIREYLSLILNVIFLSRLLGADCFIYCIGTVVTLLYLNSYG